MRNEPYEMLDPTGELSPVIRTRTPPPEGLDGMVVGLLCIAKERSEEFLDTLETGLAALGISVRRLRKPTHTKPAPADVIQDAAEHCDVVVEGLAD